MNNWHEHGLQATADRAELALIDALRIVAPGIKAPASVAGDIAAIMRRKGATIVLQAELDRTAAILNTPIIEPFITAATAEARHQRFRWGDEADAAKTAWDWFWHLGYLGGKAAHAALAGDLDKALHHTVTAAALLANWHRHIIAARELQRAAEREAR